MDSAARREYLRNWRAANPDRVMEHRKRYLASNRERIREVQNEHSRKWRAANPDKSKKVTRDSAARRRTAGLTQEYLRTPQGRYNQQKAHAKQRGIEFLLTFEQWLELWTKSGHLNERGRGAGAYNMCRIADQGPYAIGNVFIGTTEQNSREGNLGKVKRRIKQ